VVDVGDFSDQGGCLQREWEAGQRSTGIRRDYRAEDVIRLRGPVAADHALARSGARRLWELLGREDAVRALGAITGHHAVQMVQAGPQAIYLTGGPVSGDSELDPFELTMAMIEAGAAGILFEDRLPSPRGDGHLGARVLIPTSEHIRTLNSARLAADVASVPCLIMARTHAHETSLLTSDADERDHEFLTGERTAAGLHLVRPSMYARVRRALACAPYADLLWLETSTPNLAEARAFADIIYSQYPGKLLAYSCSPAFDWAHLDDASIAEFQEALAAMGYRFQFIAATGSHGPNESIPGSVPDDRLPSARRPERVQVAVSAG
jgi:isocitrate lyase